MNTLTGSLARSAEQHPMGEIADLAAGILLSRLTDAPEDCRRFVETLCVFALRSGNTKHLARDCGVHPSTLNSRFWRASLPMPKVWLARLRVCYAVAALQRPGPSTVRAVADLLHCSSPQTLTRSVQVVAGCNMRELRVQSNPEQWLRTLRAELIDPYLEQLHTFSPIASHPPRKRAA